MFCTRCGAQIMPGSNFCPRCGTSFTAAQRPAEPDAPNSGYTALGIFVPIAGLILWAINHDTKPKLARSAGIGAIIGACLSVASAILFYIIYFALMASVYAFL